MNYADNNPYRSWGLTAAEAPATDRATFIRQTYLHLAVAVLAFVGLEWALLSTSLPETMLSMIAESGRVGWLVVLGGFIGATWIADRWAKSSTNVGMQYLGLSLYVVAEAVIFLPLLYIAGEFYRPDLIPTAGILTAIIFCGLTAIV